VSSRFFFSFLFAENAHTCEKKRGAVFKARLLFINFRSKQLKERRRKRKRGEKGGNGGEKELHI